MDEYTPAPWYANERGDIARPWPQTVVGGKHIASFLPRCNNDEQGDSDNHVEIGKAIARANCRITISAVNSYARHFGPDAVKAAEDDLLGRFIIVLRKIEGLRVAYADDQCVSNDDFDMLLDVVATDARAILARVKEHDHADK